MSAGGSGSQRKSRGGRQKRGRGLLGSVDGSGWSSGEGDADEGESRGFDGLLLGEGGDAVSGARYEAASAAAKVSACCVFVFLVCSSTVIFSL